MALPSSSIPALPFLTGAPGAIALFLAGYNRAISRTVPPIEDWYLFGGVLADLRSIGSPAATTAGAIAEGLLDAAAVAAATGDQRGFERLSRQLEQLALPSWTRRMAPAEARSLDEIHVAQTGARLGGLAAAAAHLGWWVGEGLGASGFGPMAVTWRFAHAYPRRDQAPYLIQIRVGPPRLARVVPFHGIDFTIAADEPAGPASRRALRRLAELTLRANSTAAVIDFRVARRATALITDLGAMA